MAELTDIRETVREKYAAAARAAQGAEPSSSGGCCGSAAVSCSSGDAFGGSLYDAAVSEQIPEAALGASLGCGVPTAVADLHEGEVVLDLGSGAGADVLISARRVGPTGRAIGLDMTDEMLELARANAAEAGLDNVVFLKGYLEEMPLADESVDVIISNCVINLSGDKPRVLREAARVLRSGGRLAVSDVIADAGMDERTRQDVAAWTGCIAGALTEAEFRHMLRDAGFTDIEIRETHRVHEHAASAIIRARKPSPLPVVSGCGLDAGGLDAQLDRYRELGRYIARAERRPLSFVVYFAGDVPRVLLERTLEVERGCCSFFGIAYDAGSGRLEIAIPDEQHAHALDAVAAALGAAPA